MTNTIRCKRCDKILAVGVVQDCPRCGNKPPNVHPPKAKKITVAPKTVVSIAVGGDPKTSSNVYVPSTKRR